MPALKKIDGGEKKHRPRRRFGQHFLRAPEIAQRIADAISPQADELIVEIGPGDGALTAPLLAAGARIFAVEIDRDLAAALRNRFADSPIQIIESDAAKMDFNAAVAGEFRAVGNLPYNISADLILSLAEASANSGRLKDAHVMVQLEVAKRLAAAPGGREYGRLSVAVQRIFNVRMLFIAEPGAFFPRPKVRSAVVKMTPRKSPLKIFAPPIFDDVLRRAFGKRRKTLANALSDYGGRLADSPLDLSRRAETLSVGEFAELANHLARL